MGKINIDSITRKNVLEMKPYSSARDEYQGNARVFLDANENPFNSPINRYPDPHQRQLKLLVAKEFKIIPDQIFLGNGSDEAIDLLIRAFCEPGISNIIGIDPSYGMYEVCANLNNIAYRKVLLNKDFTLNCDAILQEIDRNTRIVFICSPNNPTGNLLETNSILKIVDNFNGLVVVDEAYIDFSNSSGLIEYINSNNNLVLLRTFSKAWGLAGIRLGMAFGNFQLISILDKIKYPYNINTLTQETMIGFLQSESFKNEWIKTIISERDKLRTHLMEFSFVKKVFPSDSNFLLVMTTNPSGIYNFLKDNGIIVRDRSKVSLCEGCLRITIGSPEENEFMINILKQYK